MGGRLLKGREELDASELARLVEQMGQEILARAGRPGDPAPNSEGPHFPDVQDIAGLIDHTLLRADATREDIVKLCREARQYNFASVCINPYWVPLAAAELAASPVKVCTVVGFPLGATSTEAKVAETEAALRVGAQEIDMVQNIGALRGGDYLAVKSDIAAVVAAAHRAGAIVKVILETALLDDHQKVNASVLAKMAKADFVKTSTGFGPSGATAHDVRLMRLAVGPAMGVKASGGIRTLDDLKTMAAAGATRIGASAGVRIVEATGGAGAFACESVPSPGRY